MKLMVRWCLCIIMLLLLLPLVADDDEDGGGAVLDAGLQWQIADAAWGRREYEDAAALLRTFANANPDHDNALEALWRAYYVYRVYRPHEERKKAAYEKATEACARWEAKYGTKDAVRLAASLWYRAHLQEHQGDRQAGIRFLQDLIKRAPGTRFDGDAHWTLGEWLFHTGRYQEAIPIYQAYRTIVGETDVAALSCFREATSCVKLNDNAGAVKALRIVVEGKFNWHGYYLYTGALDAAKQLKALGEDQLAREMALKLIEKGPQNETYINPAKTFLGENVSKRILIYPQFYDQYFTSNINLDSRTKLEHTIGMDLLVRLSFITKEEPFEGVLKVIPKQTMAKLPDNAKTIQEDGKTVVMAEFKAPDANGNVPGDTWFKFTGGVASPESPMDNLVVTRKWEKVGNTWGECTIRIQSSARWELFIKLNNEKTNPDNMVPKPYYTQNGGKDFYFPGWMYDPTHGVTFKFPVEVGAATQEYYPEIYLYRGSTPPYKDANTNTENPEFDFRFFKISMTSPKEFPCSFYGPTWTYVTVREVIK